MMPATDIVQFSTRREFEALLRQCLASASRQLQLFDSDFSVWPLEAPDVATNLKRFLLADPANRLALAMHTPAHLERHCPRFMQLLIHFSHAIECRVTPSNLRQLADSFCIADGTHQLRRFDTNHFRGEATFAAPALVQSNIDRFSAIWSASKPVLHSSKLGL